MRISSIRRLSILSAVSAALALVPYAEAAPNDFDSDGISDFTYLTTSGNQYRWRNSPSGAGGSIDTTFGLSSDYPALASWSTADMPGLCTVRPNLTDNVLVWRLLLETELISLKSFGKPGDTVVLGADFDGNGEADAAVVRAKNGKLVWSVVFNFFSDPSAVKRFKLGKPGDRVTYVNVEGGADWAAVFGLNAKKRAVLSVRNVQTGQKHSMKGFPRGLARGLRPRPMPIEGESGIDNLAFVSEDESDTTVRFFTLDAEELPQVTLPNKGTLVIGNYDDDEPGEEVALQTASNIRIYNPESAVAVVATIVPGVPIGEFRVENTAGATPTPAPTATPTPTPTATATP